jgi:hypothetical protein
MSDDICCDYCKGSCLPGIHLPTDFDDREASHDGMVFVARCDECYVLHAKVNYSSDEEAANVVSILTGWTVFKSFDKDDSIDEETKAEATYQFEKNGNAWSRPYFKITIKKAAEACALGARRGS